MDTKNSTTPSEIRLHVGLDAEKFPVLLEWEASAESGKRACKAFLLSLWDREEMNTMKIDLWTKDMPVEEMGFFIFETLLSLAGTYRSATGDAEGAEIIARAGKELGTKLKLIR